MTVTDKNLSDERITKILNWLLFIYGEECRHLAHGGQLVESLLEKSMYPNADNIVLPTRFPIYFEDLKNSEKLITTRELKLLENKLNKLGLKIIITIFNQMDYTGHIIESDMLGNTGDKMQEVGYLEYDSQDEIVKKIKSILKLKTIVADSFTVPKNKLYIRNNIWAEPNKLCIEGGYSESISLKQYKLIELLIRNHKMNSNIPMFPKTLSETLGKKIDSIKNDILDIKNKYRLVISRGKPDNKSKYILGDAKKGYYLNEEIQLK